VGLKTKFEDLRGKFDRELKSLKERFEGELRMQQKAIYRNAHMGLTY
jgi:hypothetical protein